MKKILFLVLFMVMSLSAATASAADLGWLQDDVDAVAADAKLVKNIWDKQSLEKIIQGKFAVPDDTINAALAQQIVNDDRIKSIHVTSKKNGRLDIHADTKQYGGIDLSGTIDACVHDGSKSYITYTVKDKDLKEHGGVTGWMFSHLSLSMLEKLVGQIELSDSLPTTISGNSVTINYNGVLQKSELAQASVCGYNLLDALRIDGAVPHDGYVELQTSLQLPDNVQTVLLNMLD